VDIYNVVSNTWRLGTPMPTARHGIYPALRGNRIYVAGGGVHSGLSYSSLVEIYVVASGSRISGATSNILSITNVQPTDAGDYALVVTNVAGSVTSMVATLTVNGTGVCLVPPSGLVGWWAGDGNASDMAGTNQGVLKGGATANAAGMVGSAFSFDGTNGYVQMADSPSLKPTNLTIEAWVRFDSLDASGNAQPGHQYIVFKQNTVPVLCNSFGIAYGLGKDRIPEINPNGDVL
jgi:hypothetical protein